MSSVPAQSTRDEDVFLDDLLSSLTKGAPQKQCVPLQDRTNVAECVPAAASQWMPQKAAVPVALPKLDAARGSSTEHVSKQTPDARLCRNVQSRHFSRATVTRVYQRPYAITEGNRVVRGEETVLELDVAYGAFMEKTAPAMASSSLYFQSQLASEPVKSVALLRDEWLQTHVIQGDTIHLCGTWKLLPYEPPSTAKPASAEEKTEEDALWDDLDDGVFKTMLAQEIQYPTMVLASFGATKMSENENLLVLHPDITISSSRLANAASCLRRPLVQERIKSPTDTSYPAIFGNIVHGVLQACLLRTTCNPSWTKLGDFSEAFIQDTMEKELLANYPLLSIVGKEIVQVREALHATIPSLVSFGKTYMASRSFDTKQAACVDDPNVQAPVRVRIVRVLGAEDDVVSPMFGLKGRIDACAQVLLWEHDSPNPSLCVMPIEIKTGRTMANVEHIAQTSLYTLLVADRYGAPVPSGLLFYAQSCTLRRVHPAFRELRSLILMRNEMASYRMRLPSVHIGEESQSDDEFDSEFAPLHDPTLPPTLDDAYRCGHCYSRDACMLYRTAVENVVDTNSPIASLYKEQTQELDNVDKAFFRDWDALLAHEEKGLSRYQKELWTMTAAARERLGRCIRGLQLTLDDSERCHFVLCRHETDRSPSSTFATDDVVLLSTDTPHASFVGRGRVAMVNAHSIELRMENNWKEALQHAKELYDTSAFSYRVDQDHLMSMMGTPRYNIACLFYPNMPLNVQRLRRRVVHLDAPQAKVSLDVLVEALVERHTTHLNRDQKAAIRKALLARDYALILGMPGTGKSTTIAALIKILAAAGQRVFLCSYTHSAVDTILTKLVEENVDILRIGPTHRIHPRVQQFSFAERRGLDPRPEAYEITIQQASVVAATALAINDPIFARQTFDVCIVDEASQITVPTCLGPLRFAERFVMIGDHLQLAPLVKDTVAAQGGMQTSLFQRLCIAHPSSIAELHEQYRMNTHIMHFSNALVYNGRLRAGNEAVAQSTLMFAKDKVCVQPAWLQPILAPDVRVAFLDTDKIPARESRTEAQVENVEEARVLGDLCNALLTCGARAEHIGVLTPYRQQMRLLRAKCYGAEVLTVDQSQGRDWRVVLVSFVRSNDMHAAGELLRDMRRLNVLLTRPKSKLIMVGSRTTLQGRVEDREKPMPRLLAMLQECAAIFSIPASSVPNPTRISPSKQRHVKVARITQTKRPVLQEVLEEQE
ncbi:DNA helicase [Malassezia vespertilionis]|uniref:DNA helicase n=1 Tax=Malassezia vespertilionis TaxID=2020962 RepID=UPI0024B06F4F|nr:DNA helicase [Malassezia vespertilionis]WFD07562.1 DNA helicase [Malassezia vespertilionis]